MMLTNFFNENIDYLRFTIGVVYFFIAMIGYGLLINYKTLRPFFIGFSSLQSLYFFIGIYAPLYQYNEFFNSFRIIVFGLSFWFMFEGGRKMIRLHGFSWFKSWFFIIPLSVFVLILLLYPDYLGVNAILICFSVPAFLVIIAGSAMLARTYSDKTKPMLILYAAFVLFLCLLNLHLAVKTDFFPFKWMNAETFSDGFKVPVEFFMVVMLNALLILLLYMYVDATKTLYKIGILKYSLLGLMVFYFIVIAGLTIGFMFTGRVTQRGQYEEKSIFLKSAVMIGNAINPLRVKTLTGTSADLQNPDYNRLKEQLTLVREANPENRFLYLMKLKNNTVYFLCDSEDSASSDYSPPGDVFYEAPPDLKNAFLLQSPFVYGPYTDRWGEWMSAYVPVINHSTGEFLAILGVDMNAKAWYEKSEKRRVMPITIVGIIVILVLIFLAFYQNNRLNEARLIMSEKKYRNLFEMLREAAFLIDAHNLKIIEYNSMAKALFGLSHQHIKGIPFSEFFRDFSEFNIELFLKKSEHQSNIVDEAEIFIAPDTRYFIEISTNINYIDGDKHYTIILKNTTKRKLAEKETEDAKERAEQLLRLTPSAVFTVDANKKVTSWNNKAEQITGYSKEEMIGSECIIFAKEPCAENCGLFCENAKPVYLKECKILTKSGEYRSILKNADLIKDSKGNIIGGIESFEDISEIKNTQQELILARREAEKANQSKSEFLANMSHEIRTPIHGVLGLAELISQTPLNNVQTDYIENIKNSTYTLLDLINDILDFSKIESGKTTLQEQPFDLYKTIDLAHQILSPRIFNKEVSLNNIIMPDVPRLIFADEIKIRQILLNLLGNSVKFTLAGEISTLVEFNKEKQQISISVIDTGIGIDIEKHQQIFEKFVQADGSTARSYGGSGLGLSIALSNAKLMNGNISVNSTPGLGSKFVFVFPFKSPGDITLSDTSETLQQPAGFLFNPADKKVLVVEDQRINLLVLSEGLKKHGFQVFSAVNGSEALNMCRQNQFDVIFMDIHMPVMDGYQAAKQIRLIENSSKTVPIIALSADALIETIEKCKQSGMDDYVSKPFSLKQLIEKLNKHLR